MKFIEYLRQHDEFECELIIDNSDMPATFVWDSSYVDFTKDGLEKYDKILNAEIEIINNDCIEIMCDDYELGRHFVLAMAGYISEKEYHRLFIEKK